MVIRAIIEADRSIIILFLFIWLTHSLIGVPLWRIDKYIIIYIPIYEIKHFFSYHGNMSQILIAMCLPTVIGELIGAGSLHYLRIALFEVLESGKVIEVVSLSIEKPQN